MVILELLMHFLLFFSPHSPLLQCNHSFSLSLSLSIISFSLQIDSLYGFITNVCIGISELVLFFCILDKGNFMTVQNIHWIMLCNKQDQQLTI